MTQPSPHFIVGIGASAGGLEALEQFFRHMPTTSGMAFVVVQHLSPNFQSLMNELLARHTSMDIIQVADGVDIRPNTIYLIPPRYNMTIDNDRLRLTEQKAISGQVNFPIDIFFKSLAESKGERAIGIVLSGTGSDGSRGVVDIHQANGLVLVQTPETANFDGMPKNALATHCVDVVAPPDQLPGNLIEYQLDRNTFKQDVDDADLSEENELSIIFALLRQKFQVDFSFYKIATILRRIQRRVTFSESHDLEAYVRRLRDDEEEIDLLYRDLLVEVTEFFRDKEAFEVLTNKIIPEIVDNADDNSVRAWIPGCATGEEAYSLAMLIHSYCKQYRPKADIKIFATDIHQKSLETASNGIYSTDRISNVPEALRIGYFSEIEPDRWQVSKTLRQIVVFAPHNLTQDPPFTRLNLVSCRNVLIYLRPDTQQKVLNYFHFGLVNNGYLFLGPSENTGKLKEEFVLLNRRWRIFRKRRDVRLSNTPSMERKRRVPSELGTFPTGRQLTNAQPFNRPTVGWQHELMSRYVPSGLLINHRFELQHVFGEANQYLRSQQGSATLDVLRLVRPVLHTAVRAALHRAAREEEPVSYAGVRISAEDEPPRYVHLTVEPFYPARDDRYYLVRIEPIESVEKEAPATVKISEPYTADEVSAEQIALLERELQYTKEHLQATVEELETTNEELQSTNEELVASNEELQSTNEELHSVNEELYTVNSEYQQKIADLIQATNDMQNLQRSSKVCTIFLDEGHRIRDFTPQAGEIFNLLPQDVGRPIEHLLYNLNVTGKVLYGITSHVMQSGELVERNIKLPTGQDFIMRVLPYRIETGTTEGIVISMVDATELMRSQRELQLSQTRYEAIVTDQTELICRFYADGTLTFVNRAYCEYFGKTEAELVNTKFFPLIPAEDQAIPLTTLQKITRDNPTETCQHRVILEDGSTRWQEWSDRGIFNDDGTLIEYQGVGRDITEWRTTQIQVTQQSKFLQKLMGSMSDVMISANANREITFVNNAFVVLFGYEKNEVLGRDTRFLYANSDDYSTQGDSRYNDSADFNDSVYTIAYRHKEGHVIEAETRASAVRDDTDNLIGFVAVIRNINKKPNS